MDDRKNDPNPKPDPAPAAAGEEEKEQERAEAASEWGEEDEDEEFVEGEDEEEEEEEEEEFEHVSEFAAPRRDPRTPFTSLSQVDADLALARTLQEQERAYMMLRMGGGGGGRDSVGSETGSEYELQYDDEGHEQNRIGDHSSVDDSDYDEDAFDAQDPASGIDPSDFSGDDEAFARALQDAEERDLAVRLMAFAGINDWVAEDARDYGSNNQDAWSEVDPDALSYEELVALGEAVGTASRGLAVDTIASLPSVSYKVPNTREGSTEQCVICRLEYEDGDSLILLSCKHMYHPECINKWLQINKVCPICNAEVSETR